MNIFLERGRCYGPVKVVVGGGGLPRETVVAEAGNEGSADVRLSNTHGAFVEVHPHDDGENGFAEVTVTVHDERGMGIKEYPDPMIARLAPGKRTVLVRGFTVVHQK